MADIRQDYSNTSDNLLLQQIVAGNLAALEQIFVRYQRQVFLLALGITRDPQTAEEVLQDTFYRLYQHVAQLDQAAPILPWLYRVAVNLSYNQSRSSRSWSRPFAVLAEHLRCVAGRSPEDIAEQHELQSIVRATLDELTPNHRAVLVLYYLYDYAIPEIADILDCPEGTVKSRLHHARKLLKDQLQRRYGGATLLPDQI